MLQDFLKNKLISEFGFEPTASQDTASAEIGAFLADQSGQSAFILKGYAGTGKTTLVRAVVRKPMD
jgi:exodeoxyribonuclease-5